MQKMLVEERNHIVEMEAEFQNQLLVQEQHHQEKVKKKKSDRNLESSCVLGLWFPDLLREKGEVLCWNQSVSVYLIKICQTLAG